MLTNRVLMHSVLNVKALVGTFNQEKALVGAFSVIVKTGCGTDGALHSTSHDRRYLCFVLFNLHLDTRTALASAARVTQMDNTH